jgi:hypothetical protein
MRIGLIDVDSRKGFPNIALMKLSAWHKAAGDHVEWYMPFCERYDRVYMSKVFSFSPDYDFAINANEVVRGGTGYEITVEGVKEIYSPSGITLPNEVEHTYPDYDLYKITDTAYGFLSRGCPRGCDFCIVGKKEGKASHKVADLSEFWRGQKNIVLCDPNILACSDWRDLLSQLADSKAKVDINQGLDARLLTTDKIRALNRIRLANVHFAWDRYCDKDVIIPKLELYSRLAKNKPHGNWATVYVLCNYDSTLEEDLERIYTLRDMGYMPYVMIYQKDTAPRVYRQLQRYVNNKIIFKSCTNFDSYVR